MYRCSPSAWVTIGCVVAIAICCLLALPASAEILQSTVLGGTGGIVDGVRGMAVDAATGEVLVAGFLNSVGFPGVPDGPIPYAGFVARLSADLSQVRHGVRLAGNAQTIGSSVVVDPATGDVIVSGAVLDGGFPGTAGGAQPDPGGENDRFIARFSGDLEHLLQATYFGGSGSELFNPVMALDPASGDVVIGGVTGSRDLPGTAGSLQPMALGPASTNKGYVARFSGDLRTLRRATYLGGSFMESVTSVAVDPSTGAVIAAGYSSSLDFPTGPPTLSTDFKGYVAVLSPDLSGFMGFQRLSRNATPSAVRVLAGSNGILCGGGTFSDLSGTAGGAQSTRNGTDGFAVHLGTDLSFGQGTYAGGGDLETATALTIDPATGDVFLALETQSVDFPATAGGAQPANAGPAGFPGRDIGIARFSPSLTSFVRSTYLGGSNYEYLAGVAVDPTNGDLIVAGQTTSVDFPTTYGAIQSKLRGSSAGFVTRISGDLRYAPPTVTFTASITPTATATPTATDNRTPTVTPTLTVRPTNTGTPTSHPTRTPTTGAPTATTTAMPTATAGPETLATQVRLAIAAIFAGGGGDLNGDGRTSAADLVKLLIDAG